MLIDTENPCCEHCGAEIEVMSRTVVDAHNGGIVVLTTGLCSCQNQWYQWYEHYGYHGHMCLEKTRGFYTRPIDKS